MLTIKQICLAICLSVCLSVHLSVCLSVDLSVCLPVCRSICLPICLSIDLSICLPACLSVHLSIYLSVCLSICLSIYLSVHLFVCLSVYLSIFIHVHPPTHPSIHPSNYNYVSLPQLSRSRAGWHDHVPDRPSLRQSCTCWVPTGDHNMALTIKTLTTPKGGLHGRSCHLIWDVSASGLSCRRLGGLSYALAVNRLGRGRATRP